MKNDINNDDNQNNNNNEKENEKNKERRLMIKSLGLLSQLGLSMACCVLIGFVAGKYLDVWLGTSPVFLIIFIFIGAAAAIKVMYDIAKDWK